MSSWADFPRGICVSHTKEHLRNLKVRESMGPDRMHLQVLKELAGELAKPVLYLRSHGSLIYLDAQIK